MSSGPTHFPSLFSSTVSLIVYIPVWLMLFQFLIYTMLPSCHRAFAHAARSAWNVLSPLFMQNLLLILETSVQNSYSQKAFSNSPDEMRPHCWPMMHAHSTAHLCSISHGEILKFLLIHNKITPEYTLNKPNTNRKPHSKNFASWFFTWWTYPCVFRSSNIIPSIPEAPLSSCYTSPWG